MVERETLIEALRHLGRRRHRGFADADSHSWEFAGLEASRMALTQIAPSLMAAWLLAEEIAHVLDSRQYRSSGHACIADTSNAIDASATMALALAILRGEVEIVKPRSTEG